MSTLRMPAVLSLRERSALYNALNDVEWFMARRYKLLSMERLDMERRHNAFADGFVPQSKETV